MPNTSIHPNPRSHKTKLRKKTNHDRNMNARRDLYADHAKGNNWQRDVSGWHEAIKGLQLGTYG